MTVSSDDISFFIRLFLAQQDRATLRSDLSGLRGFAKGKESSIAGAPFSLWRTKALNPGVWGRAPGGHVNALTFPHAI